MSNSLKDSILSADDQQLEAVTVSQWKDKQGKPVTVYVRTMTGAERDKWEAGILDAKGKVSTENIRAKFLVQCLCDEKGGRIFADNEFAVLGKKSAVALQKLFEVAKRLNALDESHIDELVKN